MKLTPDETRRVVLLKGVSDRKVRGKSVADALSKSVGANVHIAKLKGERLRPAKM